jgi:hypothetical protein
MQFFLCLFQRERYHPQGWLPSLLLFVLFGVSFNNIHAQDQEQLKAEIHKIRHFDLNIDPQKSPAQVIGIIMRDSIWIMGFGTLEDTPADSLQQLSFEIGPLSQLLTAAYLIHLNEQGQIDLDSCMTQTNNPCTTFNQRMNHLGRDGFAYSPKNYEWIEEQLSLQMNKSFDSLLLSYLQNVLALNNTLAVNEESSLFPGFNRVSRPVKPAADTSTVPGIRLQSTIGDLIQFCRFQLGQIKHPAFPDIGALQEAVAQIPYRKRMFMANGWHRIQPRKKAAVYLHTGATEGHRAYICFCPEYQTAVISFSNSPYGLDGLEISILEMLHKALD